MIKKDIEVDRFIYIDICKGILIIMLIFCHINSMARSILPELSMEKLEMLDFTKYLYAPYFMQTFFFITGYCSNFKKSIKSFLIANTKSLIIPLIFFATLNQLFDSIVFKTNFFFVEVLGREFFFLFELFWFLPALFIAKFLMLLIHKLTLKIYIQSIIVGLLFVFASMFIGYHFHAYNYLHWHNALSMLPFLWLGFVFRKQKLMYKLWWSRTLCISVSYIGIVAFLYLSNRLIPYYTHFHHYTYKYIPLYLWLAFSGTILIIQISKLIPPKRLLTYLGKNTIVVYGLHFTVLSAVIIGLKMVYEPSTLIGAVVFYLLTAAVTIFIVYSICHLFSKRPLTYLIGRF